MKYETLIHIFSLLLLHSVSILRSLLWREKLIKRNKNAGMIISCSYATETFKSNRMGGEKEKLRLRDGGQVEIDRGKQCVWRKMEERGR